MLKEQQNHQRMISEATTTRYYLEDVFGRSLFCNLLNQVPPYQCRNRVSAKVFRIYGLERGRSSRPYRDPRVAQTISSLLARRMIDI